MEAIDAFRASLDRANENYMALEREYAEFLSQQGSDWSSRFSGMTLVAYAAAVKDYADLSARIEAASLRLSEADAAVRNNGFLSVSGLQQAVSLVQDLPVTVTGDILVLEKRTLFGSAVQQFDYLPSQLLQNMGQLFDRTNQALSQIMPAFRDASENEGKVAELLASVNTLVGQLTVLEVSATPYDVRRAAILSATQQFSDKMLSDPLSAYNESSEVVNSAQLLIDDLKKAIALVAILAQTQKCLSDALGNLQAKRQEAISYSFPSAETPADVSPTFLLAEPGHNPDAIGAQVRQLLASASRALQQGNVAECSTNNELAIALIDDLPNLVTASLAARSFVSREVVPVGEALEKLREEIPLAQSALTALGNDFMPGSFSSVARNVTAANAVAEQVGGQLDEVKSAYFKQYFMAAEKQLIAVRSAIQSSREGLSAIHIALDTLLKLKAAAQEANRNLQIAFSALEVKLSEKDFSTSARTIAEVGLQRKQVALVSNLASSVKPDWAKIKQDAEQLARAIHLIAQVIDSQVLAHSVASRGLELSQSRFENAALLVSQDQVRDAAASKLQSVRQLLSAAQLNMQTAHYDWKAVSQNLAQVDEEIAAAEELAKADIELADTSARAIHLAKCRIEEVPSSYATVQEIGGETISFGADVVADTSDATAILGRAQAALLRKEYEEASRLADLAKSTAQTAQENAENAVEALVAAAVQAWQLVEKQRLEVLAEEERQAKLVRDAADELLREQQAAELIISSTVIVDSCSDSTASSFSSENADTGSGSFGGGDIAESESFTTDDEPEDSGAGSFGGGDF
jgi:SHS2 domain-containing protein